MPVNLRSARKVSAFNMKRLLIAFFCSGCAISAPAEEVLISTNLGEIMIELDEEKAPVTVAHFLGLVDSGAYKDTIFHRVIPGFMVQGGGYYLDMAEAEESEMIINEADNGLSNVRGTIAMARMSEIDSASRQFFINLVANKRLNHGRKSCTRKDEATVAAARARGSYKPTTCKSFGYAVFGKVTSGMDVMDMIEITETRTVGEYDDVPVTPIVILSIDRMVTEKAVPDSVLLD
jgi:peptidyl-prolyl cis-trans isomerase A (cyclophilin A)